MAGENLCSCRYISIFIPIWFNPYLVIVLSKMYSISAQIKRYTLRIVATIPIPNNNQLFLSAMLIIFSSAKTKYPIIKRYVYSTRLFPPMESHSLNNGNGNPKIKTNQNGIDFFVVEITFFISTDTPTLTIEITNKYNKNQNCPTENPPSAPVKSVYLV
nr:hypothetical protein [Sporofaciens musculi]